MGEIDSMNQNKKAELIEQVNGLLQELNQSLADNSMIKNTIQTAYNRINQPEKTSQKYNQISDSIKEMNYQFQQMALKKQYQFDTQQNDLINQLNKLSEEAMLKGGMGIINGAVWHN